MKVPEFPPLMQVETLNKCNLLCRMCPITQGETTRPKMDSNLYEKIVRDCTPYSKYIIKFGLFLLNEPLLDPDLSRKISLAKENGIKNTYISTNGELLYKQKIIELFKSGLDEVIISIESNIPEVHEKIRPGANLIRVKKNIENLIKLREKFDSKMKIKLRPHANEENKDELNDFKDYWLSKGVDLVVVPKLHNWGGKFEEIHPEKVGSNICDQLWKMMVIQSDGNVCLCCLDTSGDYSLGNVYDNSLYEIWHGERYEKMRQLFLEKEIQKCISCNWTPGDFTARWEKDPNFCA